LSRTSELLVLSRPPIGDHARSIQATNGSHLAHP
jgi:hypothetical protein